MIARPRVVLVDDHPVAIDGTQRALQQAGTVQVVGIATTATAALRMISVIHPDVVVLDLHLPDMGGLEIARRLPVLAPACAIVVLTGYDDFGFERVLTSLGAKAYLRKTATGPEIAEAVWRAANGIATEHRAASPSSDQMALEEPLTPRELEVLQLVVAGMQNGEIAEELGLKLRTVEFHVTNILEKLDARSRSDARELAIRMFSWATPPTRRRTRRGRS